MIKKSILPEQKELFSKLQIESGVFLFLLVSFAFGAKKIDGWVAAWYAMDYSLGFGSRLLIGSILKFFYNDYLNSWLAYCFVFVSMLILLAMIALFIGFCIRNAPAGAAKQGITLLSFLYLACPASPGYLWTTSNMGRLDLYLLMLTLMTCLVFLKISSFTLQCVCWGVIGILCIAIHQVYVFIFFPLTLVIIVSKLFDSGLNARYVATGAGTIAVICGAFLCFQFFAHIHFASVEELYLMLAARTNLNIDKNALQLEYFAGFSDHFNLVRSIRLFWLMVGAMDLVLLGPLIAVYGYLWIKAYRLSPKKRFENKYLWMLLVMLAYLPAFVITPDWGRWFAAFFTVQFLAVVVLLQKGDPHLTAATENLVEYFKQRKYFFVLSLLYLTILGKLESGVILLHNDNFTLHSHLIAILNP